MKDTQLDMAYLRQQIVGVDSAFDTPFGERLMSYCDYTASGRCLLFIEEYLQRLQRGYANTHTEDDITGRSMSQLLHDAEEIIKESVNAGPDGRIIACGTGATGAIDKFQQLIGVALSPVTRDTILRMLGELGSATADIDFAEFFRKRQPVVFIGPYEHHSNEISWRESLATTIEVSLDANGDIDLQHLEGLLQDSAHQGRLTIGSFSAASNVTGIRSDVKGISSLLHAYGALACFDYAACAPYVDIDMNPDPIGHEDPSIDAVFISPHKFLGGPGSSGVLVFNQRIYRRDLPPSVGAGGTVDYVGLDSHDFISRIEEREKAGTPGVLQTLKAGLVFQLKDRVGTARIIEREHVLTERMLRKWTHNDNIEILGNTDPAKRVSIVSFNIRTPTGDYLHHKFVTALLNDLFGIQSRAGCSCAGPYGHRLLQIDTDTSNRYRDVVKCGYSGMKPGWCRIGLHWVMDDSEANFVIDAVNFIANFGHLFLNLYDFDLYTGTWTHKHFATQLPKFSLDSAFDNSNSEIAELSPASREKLYDHYLAEAKRWADQLTNAPAESSCAMEGELGELQFFSLPIDAMDS